MAGGEVAEEAAAAAVEEEVEAAAAAAAAATDGTARAVAGAAAARVIDGTAAKVVRPVWKSNLYSAFVLNRRVDLHAIDAAPARWRGNVGSSPLDGASRAPDTG